MHDTTGIVLAFGIKEYNATGYRKLVDVDGLVCTG